MKKSTISFVAYMLIQSFGQLNAQQNILNKVKVYFNQPVDHNFGKGVTAIYLKDLMMDTIAAYINRAKYTVDIAQYDYTSNSGDTLSHIAMAVNNAYARGVKVRWIYDGSSSNSGLSELNTSIPTEPSPTGGNYGISHNKFVVIDEYDSLNAIVSTGSEDWSKWMDYADYNNIVFVQSRVLARAYTHEFNIMWGDTTHGSVANLPSAKFGTFKPNSGTHTFTIAGSKFELYFSPSDGVNTQVINFINSANTDMYCGMYDFTQTQYSTPYVNRTNAGVYSSCILDQYSSGSSAYTVLAGTLNFAEYTGSQIYHNKYMIVDPSNACSDPAVFTGSMNWTAAGYDQNDENSLIIHNDTIAKMYLQAYAKDYEVISGSTLDTIHHSCIIGIDEVNKGNINITAYPNPFNNKTTISYTLVSDERVSIAVFDITGRKVCTLAENELQSSGQHSYVFNGAENGIYLVRITVGNNVFTQKLVEAK